MHPEGGCCLMCVQKKTVAFHEILGISGVISSWVFRRTIFIKAESFALRQLLKFFRPSSLRYRAICEGDLERSPGLRKAAHEQAIRESEKILVNFSCLSEENLFGIDMSLIVRKFLVEVLSNRHLFYGFVGQYAAEHPEVACVIYAESVFPGDEPLSIPGVQVVSVTRFPRARYLLSVLTMPIYCALFYRKNRGAVDTSFIDSIVCQVDGKKSYAMFSELFGGLRNLRFVIDKRYLIEGREFEYFGFAEAQRLGIVIKNLDSRSYARLKKLTQVFVMLAIRNGYQLALFGALLFEIYRVLTQGILQSINAKRSLYLTYEHLFVPNAVRNELLRADGNVSISFPYGVQIESHYFACGYQYNYDVLCSTGRLQERLYALQQARTEIVLPVGSYEVNKGITRDDKYRARVKRLSDFKGQATAITILSSGIQDETYSGEVSLIRLARRLAEESGVKVFIRPKPLPPPVQYRDTIANICGGVDSILVTGPEYQLTDFLEITDLFVTFGSHSAADICAAGGNIFSINFLHDHPFSLWQSAVPGVFLEAESAFDSITAWIRDSPPGQRATHERRMEELSGLISYKSLSFDSYKSSLLTQLKPFFPGLRA